MIAVRMKREKEGQHLEVKQVKLAHGLSLGNKENKDSRMSH